MGKFDPYKVNLKAVQCDVQELSYQLNSKFFMDIGGEDVQKGRVNVNITLRKVQMMYEFVFQIDGVISIPCDRCLDEMDFPTTSTNRLIVKFGKEYSEESDEIIIIPEDEGEINLAWFIYEFIVLTIPIKHVHAPGKCNKTMTSKLKKHAPKGSSEDNDFDAMMDDDIIITDSEDEGKPDPRWDALKGYNEDNNN